MIGSNRTDIDFQSPSSHQLIQLVKVEFAVDRETSKMGFWSFGWSQESAWDVVLDIDWTFLNPAVLIENSQANLVVLFNGICKFECRFAVPFEFSVLFKIEIESFLQKLKHNFLWICAEPHKSSIWRESPKVSWRVKILKDIRTLTLFLWLSISHLVYQAHWFVLLRKVGRTQVWLDVICVVNNIKNNITEFL